MNFRIKIPNIEFNIATTVETKKDVINDRIPVKIKVFIAFLSLTIAYNPNPSTIIIKITI